MMINLLKKGKYRIIETKNHIRILYLGRRSYAWIQARKIGQILVISRAPHRSDAVLATGQYYIYDVDKEPLLTDTIHLELQYGNDSWQGYLLITGLPNDQKIRTRIIPTTQTITHNEQFPLTTGLTHIKSLVAPKLKLLQKAVHHV